MQKTVYDDLCFKEKSYLCTVLNKKICLLKISLLDLEQKLSS